MAKRRRSSVRRLLLLVAVVVLFVIVGEPLAITPRSSLADVRVTHGLGLRPVLTATEGACDLKPSPTVIWSAETNTCYHVSSQGIQVTQLHAAEVSPTEVGTWNVRLVLNQEDAAALSQLTAQLSPLPPPRNWLAIILHGPPGGHLLAAPLVEGQLDGYVDLDGGQTEADANALLQAILQ